MNWYACQIWKTFQSVHNSHMFCVIMFYVILFPLKIIKSQSEFEEDIEVWKKDNRCRLCVPCTICICRHWFRVNFGRSDWANFWYFFRNVHNHTEYYPLDYNLHCLVIVGVFPIGLAKKKYGFNVWEHQSKLQAWQYLGIIICLTVSVLLHYMDWEGFKQLLLFPMAVSFLL